MGSPIDNPDDEKPKWSTPRRLTNGIMMCKPTLLSTGEWVLPVSTWRKTDNSAKVVVSTDQGKTWSQMSPFELQHPSARFFIRRLNSGLLLLVKHGPIDKKTGRQDLSAFLSKDDGLSWYGGLLLDERVGVSYPDGVQGQDKSIYIIYDYSCTEAKEILLAKFTEDDVAEGRCVSDAALLRVIVSKASSYK